MSLKTYKALFISSSKYEVLSQIFRLVGFDVIVEADTKKILAELEDILETRIDDYALIVMPEEFVEPTRMLRAKVREKGRSLPVFLFLPDISDPKYTQLEELDDMLRRALGIRLPSTE